MFSSAAVSAPITAEEVDKHVEQLVDTIKPIIGENTARAQTTDVDLYMSYMQMIVMIGTEKDKRKAASKAGYCSFLWGAAKTMGALDDGMPPNYFDVAIYRAATATAFFLASIEGKPDTKAEAEKLMKQIAATRAVAFTPNNVYICAALDMAMYNLMIQLGQDPFPPPAGQIPSEPEPKKKPDPEFLS